MSRINHNGYVEVYWPEHHRARGNGYVFEHIIVMEEKLGRRLLPGEQVHHLNENKEDNRPPNLEVLTISEHARHHSEGRRKGTYKACEECGKLFYRKPSHVGKAKYCSRECVGKNSSLCDLNKKYVTKQQVVRALNENDWDKKLAAKSLGLHWSTIYGYIKEMGLKKDA